MGTFWPFSGPHLPPPQNFHMYWKAFPIRPLSVFLFHLYSSDHGGVIEREPSLSSLFIGFSRTAMRMTLRFPSSYLTSIHLMLIRYLALHPSCLTVLKGSLLAQFAISDSSSTGQQLRRPHRLGLGFRHHASFPRMRGPFGHESNYLFFFALFRGLMINRQKNFFTSSCFFSCPGHPLKALAFLVTGFSPVSYYICIRLV